MKESATGIVSSPPAATGLQANEERWKFALEGAGDGVWDWDLISNTVVFSRQWKIMLGFAENEITDRYEEWEDRVHPDDLPGALSLIKEHLDDPHRHYSSEFRMRCKDGTWKWILARGMISRWDDSGRPTRLIGTHTDISAQKAAKDRESANLKLIVEEAPLNSVLEAIVRSVEAAHPAIQCAIMLADKEANLFFLGAAPSLPECFRQALDCIPFNGGATCAETALKSGMRAFVQDIQSSVEVDIYREAAAQCGVVACWCEPIIGASGNVHGCFTCYHRETHTPNAAEISAIVSATRLAVLAIERDQEKQALHESEERYRLLAENAEDIVCLSDMDGQQYYLSPSYHRKTGWTPEEVKHSDWHLRPHPEDAAALLRTRQSNLNGETSTLEHRLLCHDGSWIWVESSCKPILRDGKVWRLLTWSHDITDRKYLEKEIVEIGEREQQRIGGELHDDLCQRLASIKLKYELFVSTLKMGQPLDAEQSKHLWQELSEATRVARGIARGLSPVADEPEGLMNALTTLVPTLEHMHGVPCFFDCPEPVLVQNRAAAAHLYRIAQELINNAARHAHPERIDVRLEMTPEHVKLEVENDGQFFQEPARPGPGMGLRILHFRANAIGARLQFLPRPDGLPGTLARCLAEQAACNPSSSSEDFSFHASASSAISSA